MSEPSAELRRALDLAQRGDLDAAHALCTQLAARDTHDPRPLALLASVQSARGDLPAAAQAAAQALAVDPGFVPALIEDGSIALRQSDFSRAHQRFQSVLSKVSPTPALLLQVAQAASGYGDREGTRAALQRAQQLAPGDPGTASALMRLDWLDRRYDEVERTALNVLRVMPGDASACHLLGEARIALGRPAQAIETLRAGIDQVPDNPALNEALARALDAADAPMDQRIAARQKVAQLVADPMRECELGLTLWLANRYDLAADAFDRAVRLDPQCLPARWARFQYPRDVVAADQQAVDHFAQQWQTGLADMEQRVVDGAHDPAQTFSLATLCSNFYFHYVTDPVHEPQRRYARLIERCVRPMIPEHGPEARGAQTDGRVNVAVFSAHLFGHTMNRLFGPMLQALDRKRVRLGIFHHHADDRAIRRDIALGDDVVVSAILHPLQWAQKIREFAPRVLLHTDIGMHPLSQCLASLRLAPTQAVLWGHPVTSGFEHIDVFLSSQLMEPDAAASQYTERLLPLPGLGTRFIAPTREAQTPPELAAAGNGHIEYLFLQSVHKNLPMHDGLLAQIAAAVPAARFHLTPSADEAVCARLRARIERAFVDAGHDPKRYLGIVRGLPPPQFLGLLRAGQINLDSIGWSGGNTTLEALWFDTPTVTLPGRSMRTRHTAAMLRLLELPQLIASDLEDYLRIAIELGRSADLRAQLAALIAQRKHRLYDDRAVVAALEAFCIDPDQVRYAT